MATARFVRGIVPKTCRDRLLLLALTVIAAASVRADDSTSVDLYGDPIPAHASVRLGTARYRGSGWRVPPLFTADDETLLTMSGQRRLALMEAATGKRVREFDLGKQNVTGVCLAPDRRSVFTFGHEFDEARAENLQTVNHWDLTAGKLLGTIRFTERSGSDNFALTPDGQTIVTASGEGTLRFWDLTTGGELLNYKIDKRRIDALAISPDGKLVAVSASDSVYLWNWVSGEEAQKIPVGWRVVSLAFSPDGSILAEGPDSRTEIVLRDVKSHKVLRTLSDAAKNPMDVNSLAFDADGRSVVAANAISLRGREIEFRVHAWDVATGTIRQQFRTGAVRPSLVAVSVDGRWIAASTGYDATVKVWDFRSGKLMGGDVPVHDGTIQTIHLSRDGGTAVTAANDGTIRIWDANTGMQRHLLRHTNWVRGCALSSDDQWIASSSLDDTVRLWEAATGKEVYRLPGHGDVGGLRAVAFSADSNRFASWGDDYYLRVWDVKTGKALLERRVHPPDITLPEGEVDGDRSDEMDFMHMDQATFSADGRLLVLVQGQSVSIFDAATGELQSRLQNPVGLTTSIHLSPDGTRVATSCWGPKNHTALVRQFPSGEELFRMELPDQGAGPVAYSADGSLLAIASSWPLSGSLIVVDGTSGAELIEFEDLPADARAIGFSADGKRLACGFGDGTALVWDLKIPGKKQ